MDFIEREFMQGVKVTGEGEPVVLLHSSLSTGRQWRTLEQQLAPNHQCINVDLLGYGQAMAVKDASSYSLATETARLTNVLQLLIPEQRFHLLGHSFGGGVALKIALEQPQRLLSLSLFEPVAFHLLEPGSEVRKKVDDFAGKVASLANTDAARYFTDTWNRPGFYDQLPSKMQRIMANDIDKVNLDFIGLISEKYRAEDCRTIRCPTNLIHGSHSPDISRTIINKLVNVFPDVIEYELDAGHMAPISHAEDFANVFLKALRHSLS